MEASSGPRVDRRLRIWNDHNLKRNLTTAGSGVFSALSPLGKLAHSENQSAFNLPDLDDTEHIAGIRERTRDYLSRSVVGLMLEIANIICSLLSCSLFVASTYQDDSLFDVIDACLLIFFVSDFIVHLFASVSTKRFIFSLSGFVDVLTILPSLIEFILVSSVGKGSLTFRFVRFLRVLRVFRLLRIVRHFEKGKSGQDVRRATLQEYLTMIILLMTMLFVSSGLLQVIEKYGTHPNDQPFLDWLYYVVVLVSGVGLGDILVYQLWSQFLIFIIFGILLAVVAVQANSLAEMLAEENRHKAVSYGLGREHVVLCGFLDEHGIESFFKEFHHPDHEKVDLDVVIIQPHAPGDAIEKAVRDSANRVSKVVFITGSLSSETDLARAAVDTATTIFLSSDKSSHVPLEADLTTTIMAMSIRHFVKKRRGQKRLLGPGPKFVIQLLIPDSVDHLRGMGGLSSGDNVMCVNLLRLQVMSKTASCPGFATIIYNLITSAPSGDTMARHFFGEKAPDWAVNYLHGTGHELYSVPLHHSTCGSPFIAIAESAYSQFKILIIGIQVIDGNEELRTVMNPGSGIIPPLGVSYGLVLAQDSREARLLSSTPFDIAGGKFGPRISKRKLGIFERVTSVQKYLRKGARNKIAPSRGIAASGLSPTSGTDLDTSLASNQSSPRTLSTSPQPSAPPSRRSSLLRILRLTDSSVESQGQQRRMTLSLLDTRKPATRPAPIQFSSPAISDIADSPVSSRSDNFTSYNSDRKTKEWYMHDTRDCSITLNLSGLLLTYSKSVPLEFAEDPARIRGLRGHIIYCGDSQNLSRFVAPLRMSHLNSIRPIVILCKSRPSRWNKIGRFPLVYHVQGTATSPEDLFKAGIAAAYSAVVMWNPSKSSEIDPRFLDSESVFAHNAISRTAQIYNPALHISTEVGLDESISFLSGNEQTVQSALSTAITSGEAVLLGAYDSLMCQCFFNSTILNSLRQLTHSGPRVRTHSGATLIPSDVFQIALPDTLVGLSYEVVVQTLMKSDGYVVLGVRREDDIDGNAKPYTITNPPGAFALREHDRLFVLSQTQPDAELDNGETSITEIRNDLKLLDVHLGIQYTTGGESLMGTGDSAQNESVLSVLTLRSSAKDLYLANAVVPEVEATYNDTDLEGQAGANLVSQLNLLCDELTMSEKVGREIAAQQRELMRSLAPGAVPRPARPSLTPLRIRKPFSPVKHSVDTLEPLPLRTIDIPRRKIRPLPPKPFSK